MGWKDLGFLNNCMDESTPLPYVGLVGTWVMCWQAVLLIEVTRESRPTEASSQRTPSQSPLLLKGSILNWTVIKASPEKGHVLFPFTFYWLSQGIWLRVTPKENKKGNNGSVTKPYAQEEKRNQLIVNGTNDTTEFKTKLSVVRSLNARKV